ncbi:hypothetical protein CGLO_15313 [Colletotrichum gloeosporioides Cg-14]|uniref:Uncharacterized protein n=1 Tax=Colletotrichum gloeosporioides (strain Cg-14) TaxID=1237896 RepID=T0JZ41_COLGC|nr:hypothetical protein CGLO_15313 [Colletotrichum gloeosporioides Cg-14]
MAQSKRSFHRLFNSDAKQETLRDQQPHRPYENKFASAYSQIESSTEANHFIPKPSSAVNFPSPINDDRHPAPGTDEATACGSSSDEPCVNELPQSYLSKNGPNTSNQPSPKDVDVLAGLRSIQVAAREAVTAAERHADALDAFVVSFVQYMKMEQTRNTSDSSNA